MIKWILLVIFIASLAYLGLCVYSVVNPATGLPDMPEADEAQYSVQIKNTGGVILTNDYETHGYQVGARVYVLHGYWEMSGKDFRFRDRDIVLDEAIFGEIDIRRR